MIDRETLKNWVDGYCRAWASNDPDDIRALFTEDGEYRFAPYEEPTSGHEAIVGSWLEGRDEQDTWTFDWQPLAIQGDTAVLEGRTTYTNASDYRNLWVIEFADDGRARSFTEWYMAEDDD